MPLEGVNSFAEIRKSIEEDIELNKWRGTKEFKEHMEKQKDKTQEEFLRYAQETENSLKELLKNYNPNNEYLEKEPNRHHRNEKPRWRGNFTDKKPIGNDNLQFSTKRTDRWVNNCFGNKENRNGHRYSNQNESKNRMKKFSNSFEDKEVNRMKTNDNFIQKIVKEGASTQSSLQTNGSFFNQKNDNIEAKRNDYKSYNTEKKTSNNYNYNDNNINNVNMKTKNTDVTKLFMKKENKKSDSEWKTDIAETKNEMKYHEEIPKLEISSNINEFIDNKEYFVLKNSENKDWIEIESSNIDELNDWVNSMYYICDLSVYEVKNCIEQCGKLSLSDFLYEEISNHIWSKSIYLVIRKNSWGEDGMKYVIGVAEILSAKEGSVSVSFLCLSRPQFVESPWCDEELFTNGQKITLKEDVRMLLDQYKMSLRYKKVKPIFPDLYPWNSKTRSTKVGEALFDSSHDKEASPSKEVRSAKCEKNSTESQNFDRGKQAKSPPHDKKYFMNCPPLENGNPKSESNSSSRHKTPNANDKKTDHGYSIKSNNIELGNKNKSSNTIYQGNKGKPEHYSKTNCTAPSQQDGAVELRLNKSNFAKPSNSKLSPKHKKNSTTVAAPRNLQPYLRGLLVSPKRASSSTWKEIEWANLDFIASEGVSRSEFYIAMVKLTSLQKTIRECGLLVSEKNLENVTNNRNKKYLFLKTFIGRKYSIIGIVLVNRSTNIEVSNESSYEVKVSYFCLSSANINTPLNNEHYRDGVEIDSNNAHNFIQKYMLAFRKNEVNAVFENIYPWSLRCPQAPSSPCKTEKGANLVAVNSGGDGFLEFEDCDMVKTNTIHQINFSQIRQEIQDSQNPNFSFAPDSLGIFGEQPIPESMLHTTPNAQGILGEKPLTKPLLGRGRGRGKLLSLQASS